MAMSVAPALEPERAEEETEVFQSDAVTRL